MRILSRPTFALLLSLSLNTDLDLDAIFRFPNAEDGTESSHFLQPPAWLRKPEELIPKIHLKTNDELRGCMLDLKQDDDRKTYTELFRVKLRFDDAYRALFQRFVDW